jgi:hypothetical protein
VFGREATPVFLDHAWAVTFLEFVCLMGRGRLIPPNRQSNLSADAEAREPGTGARPVAKTIIEIECAEVWRQISTYLDGELDPGLRATMASHFKDCAHCRAVLDGTENVLKLVGDERAFEISSGVSERFYQKLKDHLAERDQNRD